MLIRVFGIQCLVAFPRGGEGTFCPEETTLSFGSSHLSPPPRPQTMLDQSLIALTTVPQCQAPMTTFSTTLEGENFSGLPLPDQVKVG